MINFTYEEFLQLVTKQLRTLQNTTLTYDRDAIFVEVGVLSEIVAQHLILTHYEVSALRDRVAILEGSLSDKGT
jgi:hypothetical protein